MDLKNHRPNEHAYTVIEVCACLVVVFIPIVIGWNIAKTFGVLPGVMTGVLAAIIFTICAVLFYRATGKQNKRRRQELREKYQKIYRVVSVPADITGIKKRPEDEIRIGDYGWEAEPPKGKNDLIYLQGLNGKWQVVWYAGFSPEQLEFVSLKPRSQYDWDYSWLRSPPLTCPFPIQERKSVSMGLPHVWGWNGPKLR